MRRYAQHLFCLFGGLWISTYIGVMIYTGSRDHPKTTNRRASGASGSAAGPLESMAAFVDRTGICDRVSRGLVKPEELNATVIHACDRWSSAQRNYFRLRESRVNQFDPSRLTIAGEHICTNDTFMIVLVHSLHKYFDRREAIRQTWGGASINNRWPPYAKINSTRIRLAFIFGQLFNDAKAESKLLFESSQYGDIIQGQFAESYRNMTLKSLTGLHWVSKYCPSARFLLKCDDDMFINVPAILNVLRTENMTQAIMGPFNGGSRVYRKGKWAISVEDYPFYYYPPYESGSGYVISADLWRPLLNTSAYVPHIFIDDVYITGILGRIVGVRHVRRTGFAYWTSRAPLPCSIANGTVLTGTRVDPRLQYSIWENLNNGSLAC